MNAAQAAHPAYQQRGAAGHGWEWREGRLEPAPLGGTFGLPEPLVRPQWRKGGIVTRLHDSLIDREHLKVRGLYESWAYEKVGERKPFDGSRMYAVMVRALQPS